MNLLEVRPQVWPLQVLCFVLGKGNDKVTSEVSGIRVAATWAASVLCEVQFWAGDQRHPFSSLLSWTCTEPWPDGDVKEKGTPSPSCWCLHPTGDTGRCICGTVRAWCNHTLDWENPAELMKKLLVKDKSILWPWLRGELGLEQEYFCACLCLKTLTRNILSVLNFGFRQLTTGDSGL